MQGPRRGAGRAPDLLGEVGRLARPTRVARLGPEPDGDHERRADRPAGGDPGDLLGLARAAEQGDQTRQLAGEVAEGGRRAGHGGVAAVGPGAHADDHGVHAGERVGARVGAEEIEVGGAAHVGCPPAPGGVDHMLGPGRLPYRAAGVRDRARCDHSWAS